MTAHCLSVNLHKRYFTCLTFFYHLYAIPDRKGTYRLFTFLTSIPLQRTLLKSKKDKQNLRFSLQCCEGFRFLLIKPIRCTNFSNLFLEWNSTCFRQFLCPSTGIFFTAHTTMVYVIQCASRIRTERPDPACTLYDIYHCCVCSEKNSCWWTEELSETCRVSLQK